MQGKRGDMSRNFADFECKTEHKSQKSEQDIKSRYDELKDLDRDSLQAKLNEEVAAQKANGTFNYELLQSSLESMRAFLPPENYQNLQRLLQSIK